MEEAQLAKDLMFELRKELVHSQQIRTQIIGFKITFVSAAIGLIVANLDVVPSQLLAIPAFSAIFFDFLVYSYSFSIKRIGYYCRTYLEPKLKIETNWPRTKPLWEEFMSFSGTTQKLSIVGNLGITFLAVVVGVIGLVSPFRLIISLPLLIVLLVTASFGVRAALQPARVRKLGLTGEKKDRSVLIAVD